MRCAPVGLSCSSAHAKLPGAQFLAHSRLYRYIQFAGAAFDLRLLLNVCKYAEVLAQIVGGMIAVVWAMLETIHIWVKTDCSLNLQELHQDYALLSK